MFLWFIVHIIKSLMGVVIKVIARLLVELALWLPLLYTVVFVIACGISGASLTALKSWYFAGLFVSFCGSFMISGYMYEKSRAQNGGRRQKSAGNIKEVRKKEDKDGIFFRRKDRQEVGGQGVNTDLPPENQGVNQSGGQFAKGTSTNQSTNQSANQSANQAESKPKNLFANKADTAEKHGFYSYQSEGFVSGYQQENQEQSKNAQSGYNNTSGGYGNNASGLSSPGGGFGEGARYGAYGSDRPVSGEYGNSRQGYDFSKTDYKTGYNTDSDKGFDNGFGNGFSGGDFNSDFMGGNRADYDDTHADYGGNRAQYEGSQDNFDIPVSGTRSFSETPKIFATRKDPTVFIYEYEGRIEYYKRTRSGMVFMYSVQKGA